MASRCQQGSERTVLETYTPSSSSQGGGPVGCGSAYQRGQGAGKVVGSTERKVGWWRYDTRVERLDRIGKMYSQIPGDFHASTGTFAGSLLYIKHCHLVFGVLVGISLIIQSIVRA